MNIKELQEKRLAALGEDPVKKSLELHRDKLDKVSNKALESLDEGLEEASVDQAAKVYDITRRHLNTLDGRSETTQQNLIIIPGESAKKYDLSEEIAQQIEETKTMVIENE